MIKISNNSNKNTEADLQGQFKKATMMLCEALLQFFYGIDKNFSEKLQGNNLPVLSQLGQIETCQQQMAYHFEAQTKQLENLCSLKDLLEQECQSRRILTEQHYEDNIIQPMVKILAPIVDMVDDAQKALSSDPDQTGHNFSDLNDAVYTQLKQFLNSYGIENVRHRPKARFDPHLMKPVKIVPTPDRNLDGCVAQSLLTGLILSQCKRLLRPESVSLYRYEADKKSENLTLDERSEQNVNTRN